MPGPEIGSATIACMATLARHYLVKGRVQGVGYRYFALEAANRYGIHGYVRNLRTGDVEVHAEGSETALNHFKDALKQGPRLSRVGEIIEEDLPLTGSYTSFSIRG
jgi:acylphosphatase